MDNTMSTAVENPLNKEEEEILAPEYTQEENEYLTYIKDRLNKSKNQRSKSLVEFDGMTYDQYYVSNAKAANSYVPPKKNKNDTRIVSGVTKEKETTLLSTLLNYNLECTVQAMDERDLENQELGTLAEDLINKSKKLELPEWDLKKPVFYKELLDQGNVFVREVHINYEIPDKEVDMDSLDGVRIDKLKWKKKLSKIYSHCDSQIINGLNVYPGNINQYYMDLQPWMATRRIISRAEAKSLYGQWDRWKNVPKSLTKTEQSNVDSKAYNDWTMFPIEGNMVEEIIYEDKWTNEYMIMLNGIMMLPIGFPLSFVNGLCEYSITKGDLEPISPFFFYSKSIPAKTKVDQQVFDSMLRAMIVKTQRSLAPPMINNTGFALSRRLLDPGKMTRDVDPDKLTEIGDNDGVTQAEFNMMKFIKGIIDQKSVSTIMEGTRIPGGTPTAREVIELKQQGMMKLGLSILGVVNLERGMCWRRLYNIIQHWTEPIDYRIRDLKEGGIELAEQYRTVTVDSTFENGMTGKKIIDFTTDDMPAPEQVYATEELLSEVKGEKIRKVYINPKLLRSLKYNFYIEIVPTEKTTSELKAAMFTEDIAQAQILFGPESINQEEAKTRWAMLKGEDPDKLFNQQPQQAGVAAGIAPPGGGQLPPEIANQLNPNKSVAQRRPSANQIVNQ